MKRILHLMFAITLLVGLMIPMATPAMAAGGTVTVVSDTSVKVVAVYNKAGGTSAFVDLSGSPLNAVRAQEPKPYPTGYAAEPPEVTNSVWDTGVSWSFQTNAPRPIGSGRLKGQNGRPITAAPLRFFTTPTLRPMGAWSSSRRSSISMVLLRRAHFALPRTIVTKYSLTELI